MDRTTLREIQRPLKERYAADPGSAVVTLTGESRLGEGVACSVRTGQAMAEAGLHPATGGDGSQLCSGDMLLEALAACAGVTLASVATSMEITVTGRIVCEGDLDFRGTLAVAKDAPVGFREIRVRAELDADASDEQLDTLLRLTERYCVVFQTIASPPTMSISR